MRRIAQNFNSNNLVGHLKLAEGRREGNGKGEQHIWGESSLCSVWTSSDAGQKGFPHD